MPILCERGARDQKPECGKTPAHGAHDAPFRLGRGLTGGPLCYRRRMPRAIVNIDVSDLGAAVRFYSEAFGLGEGRHFGANAIEVTGAGVTIILLLAAPGTPPFEGATVKRDYARHWTPVHLDFAVRHIETAVQRAVGAGAKLEADIETYDFGRMAILSDPFGHGVCLIEFNAAGYDALTTR